MSLSHLSGIAAWSKARLGIALIKAGHRLIGIKISSGSVRVRGKEYRW